MKHGCDNRAYRHLYRKVVCMCLAQAGVIGSRTPVRLRSDIDRPCRGRLGSAQVVVQARPHVIGFLYRYTPNEDRASRLTARFRCVPWCGVHTETMPSRDWSDPHTVSTLSCPEQSQARRRRKRRPRESCHRPQAKALSVAKSSLSCPLQLRGNKPFIDRAIRS